MFQLCLKKESLTRLDQRNLKAQMRFIHFFLCFKSALKLRWSEADKYVHHISFRLSVSIFCEGSFTHNVDSKGGKEEGGSSNVNVKK